jgi:hypothetical protein
VLLVCLCKDGEIYNLQLFQKRFLLLVFALAKFHHVFCCGVDGEWCAGLNHQQPMMLMLASDENNNNIANNADGVSTDNLVLREQSSGHQPFQGDLLDGR